MSLEAILKNVYTFLDVLQMALSDRVQQWDTTMLDNSLRWAKYCTQLYEQAVGKPYRGDLDRQIQELGRLPWLLGEVKVDLEMMSHAEELLKQAVLQNRYSPTPVLEYIIGLYHIETPEGRTNFIQMCRSLTLVQSTGCLLTELIRPLHGDGLGRQESYGYHGNQGNTHGSNDTATSNHISRPSNHSNNHDSHTCSDVGYHGNIGMMSEAQLLTDFLYGILARAPPQKLDRSVSFLKKKLIEISGKPDAMVILTAILKCGRPNVSEIDEVMVNRMKTVVLHTIMELPVQYRTEFNALMTGCEKSTSAVM